MTPTASFFGEVFGDHFGQTEQRDIHFIELEAFFHNHATVGTGGDDRVDTEFLDL